MGSRIVVSILCHNDLIYLKNLIPQVEKFADRIIITDDCSDDGTKEYLATRRVEHIVHKFNLNFSDQRNIALQEADNDDWFFRIDSDELPTLGLIRDIRGMLKYFESNKVNRTIIPIYHLTSFGMCHTQMGTELRLFKKNSSCIYKGNIHEEMDGIFGNDFGQASLPSHYGLVHFKYFDKNKLEYTEKFFIPNKLYDQKDWKGRKAKEITFLPPFITYNLNEELDSYLCTNLI